MSKMEIAICAKAKQGYIYRYMKENNLTATALAEKIGTSAATLGSVINFKWLPATKRKNRYDLTEKLENFFHLPIEDLFPPELTKQIAERLSKKYVVFQEIETELLEYNDLKYIDYNPQEDNDPREKIEKVLKSLTPREEKVIRERFGLDDEPKTLREIGRAQGTSQERIRQIESKALRKLRNPSRSRHLLRET